MPADKPIAQTPPPEISPAKREFRWKPFGLGAGLLVAVAAMGIQLGIAEGAIIAGIVPRGVAADAPMLMAQTAAWAGAPFLLYSLLVEPLVERPGAWRAAVSGLGLTLLAWGWAAFEALRAASGITEGSLMPSNSVLAGALILVLPLPLFLGMAVIGRFWGRLPWRRAAPHSPART
jgi:hypothetical protein